MPLSNSQWTFLQRAMPLVGSLLRLWVTIRITYKFGPIAKYEHYNANNQQFVTFYIDNGGLGRENSETVASASNPLPALHDPEKQPLDKSNGTQKKRKLGINADYGQ
jgi:hypothetical protein